MAPTTIPPNRNPPNNVVNTNDTGTKLAIKRLLAINPNTPLYIKYSIAVASNEPTAPIIIPSITKGHLINQSVAPTNFY